MIAPEIQKAAPSGSKIAHESLDHAQREEDPFFREKNLTTK